MNAHKGWGSFKDNSEHLVSFLKGFAVQQVLSGQDNVDQAITLGLDNMADKGLPQLQSEVAEIRRWGNEKELGRPQQIPTIK